MPASSRSVAASCFASHVGYCTICRFTWRKSMSRYCMRKAQKREASSSLASVKRLRWCTVCTPMYWGAPSRSTRLPTGAPAPCSCTASSKATVAPNE
uniref:Uncharacterized protein n=1 Tax=Ixodes ricinus TaxID=34613 RepID=A0A147BVG9_IXORI